MRTTSPRRPVARPGGQADGATETNYYVRTYSMTTSICSAMTASQGDEEEGELRHIAIDGKAASAAAKQCRECGRVVRLVDRPVAALRSHRPNTAFRKVILDGDRRSDGRYLEISASSCEEGATLDWRWPLTYGSGPFAPATPCTHVPGRYSGPKSSTPCSAPVELGHRLINNAAQTSLNMVLSSSSALFPPLRRRSQG